MAVHSIKKYKEALTLLPDIETILKILNLVEGSLTHYNHYMPAYKVLITTRDQKRVLEMYYRELVAVKNSKGLKVEN